MAWTASLIPPPHRRGNKPVHQTWSLDVQRARTSPIAHSIVHQLRQSRYLTNRHTTRQGAQQQRKSDTERGAFSWDRCSPPPHT
eukprot:2521373-Prymnesium_polylepis.1